MGYMSVKDENFPRAQGVLRGEVDVHWGLNPIWILTTAIRAPRLQQRGHCLREGSPVAARSEKKRTGSDGIGAVDF